MLLGLPASENPRVLLASMPWAMLEEPPPGLSILRAQLVNDGIACRVKHLNLLLLRYLKWQSYDATGPLYALNDFVFTKRLQDDAVAPDQMRALVRFVQDPHERIDLQARRELDPAAYVDYAMRLREEIIPKYLEDCLQEVLSHEPTMLGFSCMYDQTFPAIALAQLVKEAFPESLIVLGGYAIERPTGPHLLKCFPFLDVIAFGEGEEKISALAHASVGREELASIPGIAYRDEEGIVRETPTPAWIDLNTSPDPDYTDWFLDLETMKETDQITIETRILPVEASRGCWYGQKSHCIFCGIDDESMRYRAKSPDRVLAMLDRMAQRYGISSFRFADYILPRAYYKTLLPLLAAREGPRYRLHWEMKANVSRADVRLMREAGVYRVQPGIESFSTPLLKKMRKGVSGIQNIFTIKQLMEHDIEVYYNLLFGFPEDEPQDYTDLLRILPLLYHFKPPGSHLRVLVTRFSPLHTSPADFGIKGEVRADRRYALIFSQEHRERIGFDLNQYCYTFERPYDADPDVDELYSMLVYQCYYWLNIGQLWEVRLSYKIGDEGIEFHDTRFGPEAEVSTFGPDHARVYQAVTERILSQKQLSAALGGEPDAERVERIVDDFIEARLVLREGSQVVGLAFQVETYERWAKSPIGKRQYSWV